MISLIFGAGASFGSDNYMVVNTPPVGDKLFHSLNASNGAFSRLPDNIKDTFKELGFEAGMGMIANDSSAISELQNELAIFLSSFSASDNNAYYLLFSRINKYFNYLCLLTLNYDLLIEQSLLKAGFKSVSYDMEDTANPARLMKLHGSSNFIPDFPGRISNFVSKDFSQLLETNKIKYLLTHEDIRRWCADNGSLSPIMCMYNRDKRAIVNSNYIENLKYLFNKIIARSNAIIIVGVKYTPHDNHVWGEILSEGAYLLLIDPYPDSKFLQLLSKRKIKHRVIKKSFHLAIDDICLFLNSRLESKLVKKSNFKS